MAPSGQMHFRTRHRLSRSRDYRRVYAQGVRKSRGPLTVIAVPNGLPNSRLGLSIGRRAGGAVTRNAIKRRVREAFRHIRLDFEPPMDIVVIARRHDVMNTRRYEGLLADTLRSITRELARKESVNQPADEPSADA